jgi:spore germination protein GerM
MAVHAPASARTGLPPRVDRSAASLADSSQLRWLLAGLVLTFGVQFLFADLAALPHRAAPSDKATTAATPQGQRVLLSYATSAAESSVAVHVYFLRGEHGALVHRASPNLTPATTAVRELLRGPTATERAKGLTSAVPPRTRLLGLTIRNGLAVVDLSKQFASGGGSASMMGRLGQLVYTLTAVPHVRRINLWLDGRLVRVFSGEGLILDQPMTRTSFKEFLP